MKINKQIIYLKNHVKPQGCKDTKKTMSILCGFAPFFFAGKLAMLFIFHSLIKLFNMKIMQMILSL